MFLKRDFRPKIEKNRKNEWKALPGNQKLDFKSAVGFLVHSHGFAQTIQRNVILKP